MEEEVEKIGFFKRVKISIFNLEKYNVFTKESFGTAFKYILILIILVSAILGVTSTVKTSQEISKLTTYIQNDFPYFTYKDGNLVVDGNVNAFDEEYQARLIVNTDDDVSEEQLEEYRESAEDSLYYFILLKDKVLIRMNEQTEEMEYHYTDIASTLGLGDITKQELIDNYLNNDSMTKINFVIWIYAFVSTYIIEFLTVLEDVLILSVFGFIATKISKVSLKFSQSASLAIYSLTLSIILATVYSAVYTFVDFEIKYFQVLYMLVAYIYMVAAIMLFKEDFNKTAGEAVTIEGQIIKDESADKEEEPEEKKKKKKEPKNKDEKENKNKDNREENKKIAQNKPKDAEKSQDKLQDATQDKDTKQDPNNSDDKNTKQIENSLDNKDIKQNKNNLE